MIRIVIQSDVAEQIRQSDGQIELVDAPGQSLGVVRRLPTEQETQFAKSRIGKHVATNNEAQLAVGR